MNEYIKNYGSKNDKLINQIEWLKFNAYYMKKDSLAIMRYKNEKTL